MKNGFLIQAVNSFITGILTVTLPLLMSERNIGIVEMGLIFSLMPIIFQLTRFLFSILSEFFGRKIFFLFNGIMAVVSNLIYYAAYTPLGYVFGKVTEGIKDGSLWAVNRAYVMDHSEEKKKKLVQLRIFSSSFEALGNLLAGFLVVWLFFQNTILFTVALGVLLIPLSLRLKDLPKKRFNLIKACKSIDFRNKTSEFKKFLLLFCISGISDGFIAGYVFTMFLSGIGMNAELIGIVLGLSLLVTGLTIGFFTKIKITRLLAVGGAMYCISLLLLGFSSTIFAIAIFIFMGLASGLIVNVSEAFFSTVTSSESYASDIGLLMTSFHGGRTISLLASGFIITSYGFPTTFALSSAAYAIYTFLTYKTVEKKAFLYK